MLHGALCLDDADGGTGIFPEDIHFPVYELVELDGQHMEERECAGFGNGNFQREWWGFGEVQWQFFGPGFVPFKFLFIEIEFARFFVLHCEHDYLLIDPMDKQASYPILQMELVDSRGKMVRVDLLKKQQL